MGLLYKLYKACRYGIFLGNERGKDKAKECLYTRNTEARSRNHIAVEKQHVLHVLIVCL
jgi:hypothetical protein